MKDNILVIGGTGKTGRRVVEKLNELNHNVRVGSRGSDPAFDWDDPSTYTQALKGMDKAYIVYYPDLAVPGSREAIEALTEAALKEGVDKVVLLSGKGEVEAQACEEIVANSGLNYTLVRASWFNQNFSESFFLDPILAGHVALPQAQAQVPYVDADDIASVVVAALTDDIHNSQTYELTGPQLLTFAEAISEIASATGREIQFQAITMDAYVDMLRQYQLSEDFLWLIEYLFTNVLPNKENAVITGDIEKVLGRKPKKFSQYAQEVAVRGVWDPSKVEIT